MKRENCHGGRAIAARVVALADRLLALVLTLLAVDLQLPRREVDLAGHECGDGVGDAARPSERRM